MVKVGYFPSKYHEMIMLLDQIKQGDHSISEIEENQEYDCYIIPSDIEKETWDSNAKRITALVENKVLIMFIGNAVLHAAKSRLLINVKVARSMNNTELASLGAVPQQEKFVKDGKIMTASSFLPTLGLEILRYFHDAQ